MATHGAGCSSREEARNESGSADLHHVPSWVAHDYSVDLTHFGHAVQNAAALYETYYGEPGSSIHHLRTTVQQLSASQLSHEAAFQASKSPSLVS